MKNNGVMAKKIPTALGILILIGGLIAGVILVNSRQGLETKAGPTESPKNVKVSNLGGNTFSVSWTTDTPVTGFLKYSEDPAKINSPAGDIRDQVSGTSQSYTNHYINVTGLNPDKIYYFVIGSGPVLYDDAGKPFQTKTGPPVITPSEDIITGKILAQDTNPVNGAIVFVETEGGNTLSTVTKTDGTWRLNLASSRDKDGKVLTYDPTKSLLSIFVQAGVSGTATAITNTSKAKPVPDIVLGKNQTFVETAGAGAGLGDAGANAGEGFKLAASPTPTIPVDEEATGSVKILNPAINGEMIATSTPEFRGKANPGTTIKISVHSAVELTQMIKADKDGAWTWTAPQQLDPGIHTLTLEYTDENNIFQKIVRSFTVLAADQIGGLPAFIATPSGKPTSTPSATLSPTKTTMPATKSGSLADAGALSTTIVLVILGIGMVLFGKLSRKWWG